MTRKEVLQKFEDMNLMWINFNTWRIPTTRYNIEVFTKNSVNNGIEMGISGYDKNAMQMYSFDSGIVEIRMIIQTKLDSIEDD